MTTLFRKRLIPDECVSLKDDIIIHQDDSHIITSWKTFHPKAEFSHGISYYLINDGFKVSKFYKAYDAGTDTYVFTDLLADVIIENSGFVRVVDLDELADAASAKLISDAMLVNALHKLDKLLKTIYDGTFNEYINTINEYEAGIH